MKTLFACLFFWIGNPVLMAVPESDPNLMLEQMAGEILWTRSQYLTRLTWLELELAVLDESLERERDLETTLHLLWRKDRVQTRIKVLGGEQNAEIAKIRYLKGLQIMKSLYEKVLGLDHHFSSVRTLGEISKIANPNQYPEYARLRELVAAKKDKKFSVDLVGILGSNTIVSLVQTFTNMIGSSLTAGEKQRELGNVACILDFTLRMQGDLNTIYYETAFLQTSNNKIKEDIETLFRDYTKPIGYMPSLEDCRKTDDWETITQKMGDYLSRLKTASGNSQYKLQVNLDFPVERLLQFIAQYNTFIDQGGKFYEKFRVILGSYENEKICEKQLPQEYVKLRADIDLAIQKFHVAYKPVEINGSRMKEILYGLNELE